MGDTERAAGRQVRRSAAAGPSLHQQEAGACADGRLELVASQTTRFFGTMDAANTLGPGVAGGGHPADVLLSHEATMRWFRPSTT
jgi:hypothetical protein